MDLLRPTEHHTYCPYKGTASYWSIAAGGRESENAVWGYPEPFDEVAAIRDYVAVYWKPADSWWEEDEEIFVHARDPISASTSSPRRARSRWCSAVP